MVAVVRESVAVVLGHAGAESVPAAESIFELGLDSLTAVELRNHLTAATGVVLPPTVVFEHVTPVAPGVASRTGSSRHRHPSRPLPSRRWSR